MSQTVVLFKTKVNEAQEMCIPLKIKMVNSKPIWMSNNNMQLVRKKRRP